MSGAQGYDLIGDVHGCGDSLKLLLERLGYRLQNGVFRHPRRQAIFLGDIVDRGPRIREALHIVHAMVEAGSAQIVMGNHEYNLLCYLTPGKPGSGRDYLRERTPRHLRILKETLEQLANYPAEQREFLDWIRQMPLFLEFDDFRVVHACWYAPLIERFRATYGGNRLTDEALHRSAEQGSFEWTLMDRLLRGTHLRLPNDEVMISRDGFKRYFFRTKFWMEHPEYYIDVAFQPDPLPEHIARQRLSEQNLADLYYYGAQERPLFIGHYWREGTPEPITENIVCLDYSAVKYGKLVAYRFDGEQQVSADKFVWVDVRLEIHEP
nr:metallophosphoesterase [Marinobacterium arenosum]